MSICPVCGNNDERFFSKKGGKIYCRKCISFNGRQANKIPINSNIKLKLDYPLSDKQENISNLVMQNFILKKDVLINAVTGAGKTELVYKAMEKALNEGKTVGFATPRKDVVIDLKPRISSAFPNASVISVYGNHSYKLEADIIVLTTHQLFRYKNYFDLLIIDEIDAFPFANNEMLHQFVEKSLTCTGVKVLLSATPSEKNICEIKNRGGTILELNKRYHGAFLPVPEFVYYGLSKYFTCLKVILKILNSNKPLFVFVPTINEGQKLYQLAKHFIKDISLVYSYEKDRDITIEKFKKGQLKCLITTTILERGVTVKDLQVIVIDADNMTFTPESLIQISGRVGRKFNARTGKVIFLGKSYNENIKKSIKTIKDTNHRALLSGVC